MTPARSNLSDLSPSPRPLSPCLTGVGGPLHSWLSYAYVKVQNLQYNTYQTFRPEIEAIEETRNAIYSTFQTSEHQHGAKGGLSTNLLKFLIS